MLAIVIGACKTKLLESVTESTITSACTPVPVIIIPGLINVFGAVNSKSILLVRAPSLTPVVVTADGANLGVAILISL